MSNPVWSQREREINLHQARRRDAAIAELPNGRLIFESDLDVTPGERGGMVVAYAIVAAAIVGVILAPLFIGGLLIQAFGW